MAFSQAVSGLNAAATNLDVIGNNIANSATAGFKSGSVSFADMFAGSQIGLGVKVAGVIQNFKGGVTTGTSRALDVAITGNGFFRMQDKDGGIFYSRNGQLQLDENRNLTNMQGLHLTGYPVAGTPPVIQQGADPVPLSIPENMMNAKASTAGFMVANLKSTHKVPENKDFDPSKQDSYNYVNTITAYDSLGNAHNINFYFVKTGENKWQVHTRDGNAKPVEAGTMEFDSSGNLINVDGKAGEFNMSIQMADEDGAVKGQKLNLSFAGSMQQNVSSDSVSKVTQDGYAAGEYTNFQINSNGTVVGIYSNRQTQILGQIVMANFSNPEGLSSQGDNLWQESGSSGQPRVGLSGSGSGGLGKLTSGALEASNVDLSQELVNMIVAQRDYQSNAQTIKTQDSILQTLVSLR